MTAPHVHQRATDYHARVWQALDDRSLVAVEYRFDSRETAESFIHDPEVDCEPELFPDAASATFFEYLEEVAVASFAKLSL